MRYTKANAGPTPKITKLQPPKLYTKANANVSTDRNISI